MNIVKQPVILRGDNLRFFHCQDREAILSGPAESGKAQPITATVWTPTGPRLMGEIRDGDCVLSPDGGRACVLGVYPQGFQDVYEIVFNNGDKTHCTLDHLWKLYYTGGGKRNGNKVREMNTVASLSDIIDGYLIGSRKRPKYYVPQALPVDFDSSTVPIDPYVLGIILGDGHIGKTILSISSADQEILDELAYRLGENYKLKHIAAYDYRISANGFIPRRKQRAQGNVYRRGDGKKWCASIIEAGSTRRVYAGSFDTYEEAEKVVRENAINTYSLEELSDGLGIWNDLANLGLENTRSHNKFIPDCYKYNSVQIRLEVLRGLMDTDGTVCRRSGMPTYTTVSQRLALDVKEIIESLGGACIVNTKQPKNGALAYNLTIQYNDNDEIFRLDRKRALARRRTKYPVRRFIKSISKIGRAECVCIAVEGGLYLTDNFIVTHNTYAGLLKIHGLLADYPGAQFAIIRKVARDVKSSVLVTYRRDILQLESWREPHPYVKVYGGENPEWFDYPNGSRLWIGGLDNPGKTLSSERDCIYVNQAEQLALEDWEYLMRCTTGRGAVMPYTQLIGDCNPAGQEHWILTRPTLTLYTSHHRDNPTLYDADGNLTAQGERSMADLASMTGARYKRLYLGQWAAPEGIIYDIFDTERHKVRAFPIPREWARIVGIDPFGDKVVALWLALDPRSQVWNVYREYVAPFGVTTEGHVKAIRELSNQEPIFFYVGGGPSERQARADFTGYGVPLLTPAIGDVWAQIDRVYAMLKSNRLMIHDACPHLLSEITNYHREVKNGTVVDGTIADKSEFHCLDALRYACIGPEMPAEQSRVVYAPR